MRRCFRRRHCPAQRLVLPAWKQPIHGGDPFRFPARRRRAPALERAARAEILFGMVARLCSNERWRLTSGRERRAPSCTGSSPARWADHGGKLERAGVRLVERYFDSPGLSKVAAPSQRDPRGTRKALGGSSVEFTGDLRAITVLLDHRLCVRVR